MSLTLSKFLSAVLLSILALPTVAIAAAPCDGFMTVTDASPALEDVTPFGTGNITSNFTVAIAPGSAGCHGKLFIDKPLLNTLGLSGALDIQRGGVTIVRSDSVTNPVYVADIVDASPIVLQIVYRKDNASQNVVNNGMYSFNVPFYVKDSSGNTILRTSNKNFNIKVPKLTHTRLVSSPSAVYASGSSSLDIAFGELTTNAVRPFYLNVRSTAAYGVRVESDNSYQLVSDGAASISAERNVGYTLSFNGTPIVPAGQVANVSVLGSATNADGMTHEFLVTIGNVSNKKAGTYSDRLVITTSAY